MFSFGIMFWVIIGLLAAYFNIQVCVAFFEYLRDRITHKKIPVKTPEQDRAEKELQWIMHELDEECGITDPELVTPKPTPDFSDYHNFDVCDCETCSDVREKQNIADGQERQRKLTLAKLSNMNRKLESTSFSPEYAQFLQTDIDAKRYALEAERYTTQLPSTKPLAPPGHLYRM